MPYVLLYLAVEIVALVAVASWLGAGWTLLILLAGTVAGVWLARREGVRAISALATATRERRLAHVEVTDGLLVAAGGLLILVPGIVSDVAGLLLVLPPTRALARRWLVRAAERRAPVLRTVRIRAGGTVVDGMVVDAPVVDTDPSQPATSRPQVPRRIIGS
ncbi:MAG TPA: FxsA family protein [Pseudonocardia sp.]|nr:FxsA family protein [Pseudonocardia sp.]